MADAVSRKQPMISRNTLMMINSVNLLDTMLVMEASIICGILALVAT